MKWILHLVPLKDIVFIIYFSSDMFIVKIVIIFDALKTRLQHFRTFSSSLFFFVFNYILIDARFQREISKPPTKSADVHNWNDFDESSQFFWQLETEDSFLHWAFECFILVLFHCLTNLLISIVFITDRWIINLIGDVPPKLRFFRKFS